MFETFGEMKVDCPSMNPRWRLWLLAMGYTETKFPYDPEYLTNRLPPGKMNYEYVHWIDRMWCDYRKAHGIEPDAPETERMHRDFDLWLFGGVMKQYRRIKREETA